MYVYDTADCPAGTLTSFRTSELDFVTDTSLVARK